MADSDSNCDIDFDSSSNCKSDEEENFYENGQCITSQKTSYLIRKHRL